jgi:hypothetical protein
MRYKVNVYLLFLHYTPGDQHLTEAVAGQAAGSRQPPVLQEQATGA